MTSQELLERADKLNCNPYYLAYALETGVENPKAAIKRDGGSALYMSWIMQRWSETCKRLGVPRHMRSQYSDDHLETLASRLSPSRGEEL